MAPLINKLVALPLAGRLVKFAPLIAGSVPVILAAGTLVKFVALTAGNVAGKRASAIVPVKFVAAKLVKFAPLIAGNVPVMFAAGTDVKLAALAVGNVAGNLASGSVPDVRLLALNAVKSFAVLAAIAELTALSNFCLLYTSPSPRD